MSPTEKVSVPLSKFSRDLMERMYKNVEKNKPLMEEKKKSLKKAQ